GATLELSKRVVLLAHLIEVEDRPSTHGMVGESGSMRAVLRAAQNVADLATGVLLTGETGSGKDRVARLIHDMSARSGRFVAVNMANVNHSTAASELFGHVKGAFTGADRRHEGLFE